jgi:Predicted N-acetylglucosamine kinase
MKLIIGVDAGGTKTAAAAYSQDGRLLKEALTGFGNLLNGPEKACENIVEGIRACLVEEAAETHVYIGAAGIAAGDNKALVEKSVREAFPFATVRVVTDSHLMLYALFEGRDGMLLISGTGSIAYSKRGEAFHRFGGWGQLLADRGSGYDIVRNAVIAMLDDYDHGRPFSPLSDKILAELDTDVFGMVKFFHSVPKGDIAALLPIIVNQAAAGDKEAAALLFSAGEYLAYMAQELYHTTGYTRPIGLSVSGSVLEKIPEVRESFFKQISCGSGKFEICEGTRSATAGAFYLHKSEKSKGAEIL